VDIRAPRIEGVLNIGTTLDICSHALAEVHRDAVDDIGNAIMAMLRTSGVMRRQQ
jgi:hypothetical protein